MAFDTGVFSADCELIHNPTGYTSGGDNLGLIGSVHRVGFRHGVELLRKQNYGIENVQARRFGTNVIYQIIVQNRSELLTEIMLHNQPVDDHMGEPTSNYGNLVTSSETEKLLLRPKVSTKPMLYFPRAFVIDVGPLLWHRKGSHLDETVLTIVGLRDGTTSPPFHYGDYNEFPALGGA